MRITLTLFEPPDHPLIDGFSTFEGSAVRTRSDEEAHLVLSAVKGVPTPSFFIDQPRAFRRKIVMLGRLDEPGRWGR